jgi:acyl-CoA thioester hydrolase
MNYFFTYLRVLVGDVNYGGHVGNDKILLYFHEARIRYLQALNLSEMDIGDGVSVAQTEAFISYKGEAFLSDELLIRVFIDNLAGARFQVNYVVTRVADSHLIATGYTVLAGFDYKTHHVLRIPKSFKNKVETYQKE